MTNLRQRRVAEFLREEISLLAMEFNDPRLGSVDVTDVEVSPDLRYARVFVASSGESEQKEQILEGLRHASAHIRRELAQRGSFRYVPELSFHWDSSVERGQRIDDLLRQAGLG